MSRLHTIGAVVLCLLAVAPEISNSAPANGNVAIYEEAAALVPASIRDKKALNVATSASYAPYEYFAKDGKTIIGFDIDVTDAVAAALGLKAVFTNIDFDSIVPSIRAERFDTAVSAITITPEREKVVDFVGPNYVGGTGLAVQLGNPHKMSMNQETWCGRTIGGEAASIQITNFLPEASKNCQAAGKQPVDIKSFKTQTQANLALVSGRIDAVCAETATLHYQASLADHKFEVALGEDLMPSPHGYALNKASKLAPALIAALKHLRSNGVLEEISKKWNVSYSWLSDPKDEIRLAPTR